MLKALRRLTALAVQMIADVNRDGTVTAPDLTGVVRDLGP